MGETVSQTTDQVRWFIQFKSVNKCKSVNTLMQGMYIHLKNHLYFQNLVKIEAKPMKIREASKISQMHGFETA